MHSLTQRCSFLGNRVEESAKIILLQVLKDAIHITGAEESDEIKAEFELCEFMVGGRVEELHLRVSGSKFEV